MAQKYRKLDPRIWRDEKFAELSEAEKLIAIYCLTAQVNRCGIFVFSPAMAAEELGTSTQTFRERFGRVVSALNWRWDSERRVLYFPRWWRYNQPENSNVLKGALSDLVELPETPLLAEFYANEQHLDPNVRVTFRERSRNVSQTVANSGTVAGTVTGTGVEDPPTPRRRGEARAVDAQFAEFWIEYPRKEAKGAAERAWQKIQPTAELFAQILAAVRAQKVQGCLEPRSDASGRSFIPHPSTWLNAKRWEDTPTPAGQAVQRMDSRTAYAVDTLRDCFPEVPGK